MLCVCVCGVSFAGCGLALLECMSSLVTLYLVTWHTNINMLLAYLQLRLFKRTTTLRQWLDLILSNKYLFSKLL